MKNLFKKGDLKNINGRRKFIRNSTLLTLPIALGADIIFSNNLPLDYIPIGLNPEPSGDPILGKSAQLTLLNDKPLNMETPAHLLDPSRTPIDMFFVRNNGLPPALADIQLKQWTLSIDGESAVNKRSFTLDELKTKFTTVSLDLTLECGGNGRSEFVPASKGNQWTVGAVGCAKFTGVRLADVLNEVGIKSDAVYIGYHGADTHLSGDPSKEAISRGVPIQKALQPESLIAWSMNDQPLPLHNGYPLRLVFGGWPASCSGKWLTGISVRNKIHDGSKMESPSYRVPCETVAPGSEVDDKDMCIIESMPVKSIITYPKTGALVELAKTVEVRGHAWAGELEVKEVYISIDFGATWQKANLSLPVNRFAWQRFSTKFIFPAKGYYEVWARAVDSKGKSQPMIVPGWNPKGYLNNACHRIAVKIV